MEKEKLTPEENLAAMRLELTEIRHVAASIRSYIAFTFWAGLLLALAGAGCSVLDAMSNLP